MSRTLLLGIVTIVTFAFCPATLRADPIGFGTLRGGGGTSSVVNQVRLSVAFGSVVQGTAILTFGVVVSTADVGRTFSLSSGPEFEAAVRFLTDGVPLGLGLFESTDLNNPGGGGSTASESFVFFGDASGASGIDFAGFEITSLELRLDELIFLSPGSDPSGNGIWTDYCTYHADCERASGGCGTRARASNPVLDGAGARRAFCEGQEPSS